MANPRRHSAYAARSADRSPLLHQDVLGPPSFKQQSTQSSPNTSSHRYRIHTSVHGRDLRLHNQPTHHLHLLLHNHRSHHRLPQCPLRLVPKRIYYISIEWLLSTLSSATSTSLLKRPRRSTTSSQIDPLLFNRFVVSCFLT